jgi:hypothetical protein
VAGEELPFVDEHALVLERPVADVWPAVTYVAERASSGAAAARVALLLGCADPVAGGPRPLAVGSTVPGFRVTVCEPGRELRLEGRHRFSRYALVYRLDALGPSRTRVRAETRAAFPGPAGRVYRALVIGTRGHVVAVRRLLAAVERRARSNLP